MAIKIAVKKPASKAGQKSPSVKGLTYRNSEAVYAAELFGARQKDIISGGNGIKRGTIVVTTGGYCLAVKDVPGATPAKVVPFKANCTVLWNNKTYPGMQLNGLNYAVVKGPKGLANVELARFKGQNPEKRANLA